MAETIKKLTRKDILNSFYNSWLEKKLAAEIDLEFNKKSSILLTNLANPSEDLTKRIKEKEIWERIIKQADEYLEIVENKLKNDN